MIGRSANGKAGKITYYEHGWSGVKGAFSKSHKRTCRPNRVLTKQLEPKVWDEVLKLLQNEKFAEELLKEAKKEHSLNPGSKEVEKYSQISFSASQQLELLAERLASLPKTISPLPIYRQMEKLESHKKEADDKLAKLRESGIEKAPPAVLKDFKLFLSSINELLKLNDTPKLKTKIIRLLISRILITQEGFEIYFKVGEAYLKIYLNDAENRKIGQKKRTGILDSCPDSSKNPEVFCSGTCINGGRERDSFGAPAPHPFGALRFASCANLASC